ncbi:hypothetical protein ACR77J_08040 [Tissierella praeacuta]|uniref:hypothetical protein n=1 Tax=Tissierella praeacuta TaxID=43131 RepID=UPI003DA3BBA5
MARPKGSKNKSTLMIEELQKKVDELEQVHNSYDEVLGNFVEGFVMNLYEQDIIKRVSNATLQQWFSNPDEYMTQITTLLTYYYIVDGNIFQLYDLIFTLPNLDYKITALEKDEQSKSDIKKIRYYLDKQIRHKDLTRDLAVQLASKGTIIGTWLGNNKNPYFYTFDDLNYIYPYGRINGQMAGVVDLKWLDGKKEEERELIYKNLSPLITRQKYEKYKNNNSKDKEKDLRYIVLPTDKTLVERIHTLSRNQRLGIPYGTQALFDMQHKQKLKDLEVAVANKIIRAIALLKFKGKTDNDVPVPVSDREKVFKRVKAALEKINKDDGITCLALPDFASFEFPEIKNGEKSLNPEKYESINNDIGTAIGISDALSNGTNSNFSSANLNLDIIYKRIAVMIQKIEIIYNQLIDIILGEKKGANYIFEYNTDRPLTKKERVEILIKLQNQGYSTKAVVDELGINFDDYYRQSIYEIEELKMRERIIPPLTSYTITSDDAGRPEEDNPDNENTISSKENGGNANPET